MNTHLCTDAYKQGTDIKRRTALVGGNPLLIEPYNLLHHLFKHFRGHLGHENAAACALQALCVFVHAEHSHLTVGAAIGLQALKGFLSVVQTGGSHVHVDVFVGANLYLAPLSVAIVATHVVVCTSVSK